MVEPEFDFFNEYIVPFATGSPELVEALRNWPPNPEHGKKLLEFIKAAPQNNAIVSLYIAKYANAGNGGLAAHANSIRHLTLISQATFMSGKGNFEPFRDAVLEFMADSPKNLAYFQVLFNRLEKQRSPSKLANDSGNTEPPEPPEPA